MMGLFVHWNAICLGVFLLAVRCDPPSEERPAGRELTLTAFTEDGWQIVSTLYRSDNASNPVLIVLHGLHSTRSVYPIQAATLKDFHVLAIDLRGHGNSILYRGKKTTFKQGIGNIFHGASNDVVVSLNAARSQLPDVGRDVVIQGSSFSCLVALNYAMKHPDHIKGIILISPGDAYGQSFKTSIQKLRAAGPAARTALLCSKGDSYCYRHIPSLQHMLAQSREMRIIIEPGSLHANALFHKRWEKYPAVLHSFILARE